jgi:large repetitive protein
MDSFTNFWGCTEHVGSDVLDAASTIAPYAAGTLIVIGGVACIVVTEGACAAVALPTLFAEGGITTAAGACAMSVCGTLVTGGAVSFACGASPICGDVPGDGPTIGCGESFAANTQVVTASGEQKPISSLKQGEKVEAVNTTTGKNETQTVQAVFVKHDTDLYDLKVSTTHGTAVIHTTANHLYWDPSTHAWTQAAKLHIGERLLTTDGTTVTADGGSTPADHSGWMWDLTISNDHDFYVIAGNAPILVHNINDCTIADQTLGPNKPSAGVAASRGDKVMSDEQPLVNEAGDQHGCSTCGASESGYSDGHWTGDHQPPNKLAPNGPWTLFPQCRACARQQGGIVNGLNQGWYDFPPETDPLP